MSSSNTNEAPSGSATTRFLIDSIVAGCAGFSLAWFITPMDAAVMENMSGRSTILKSLQSSAKHIAFRPHNYLMLPQFRIVVGTYGATYLAKNYTDSACLLTNQSAEATAFMKLWFVFAVNGGLSVFWKDPALARIFGTKAQGKSIRMPMGTYFWWCSRDLIHIIGAAVLPDYCEQRYSWDKNQWKKAQLSFPVLVQFLTTPCHLMGLDYYNYADKVSVAARVRRVVPLILPSVGVRMIRMFAPWSIGLVINRDLRDYLMATYSTKEDHAD